MKSPGKRAALCIIAIAFGILMVSCTGGKPSENTAQIPSPPAPRGGSVEDRRSTEDPKKAFAAKVNGVAITSGELVDEMNAIAPQYVKPGQKRDPKIDERIRNEAFDRLVDRELAVQQARKEGMKVPAGAVVEEMKRIRAEMKTGEAFRQKLAKSGMTVEELEKRIERNMLVEMITEKEIFGKVAVDHGEARKIYERNYSSRKGSSRPMTFEEARPLIEKELMTSAVQKRENEWVAEMRKGARIEIAP
jgi:hypothetical protein